MFDIAVIGSGFAGTLTALIARRLGRSVILLERGQHPRFAIGESSTPLANLLWEELTHRYDLPRLLPLSNWGDWQRTYPHIGCGLKRGFTFFQHADGERFADPSRQHQLLVGASPRDADADTHWYRPDFDHFLVSEAEKMGVEYLDLTRLDRVEFGPASAELSGQRGAKAFRIRARFVIDATGPRGFLQQQLNLPEATMPAMPSTAALYTHFRGVKLLADIPDYNEAATPPFPIDAAAVHHVFRGGWIWVLRFNNGIVSAGVAATETRGRQFQFEQGAHAWARLLANFPSIGEQFATAQPTRPFVASARLTYRAREVAGRQWALLPSAAGFVDPLLSSGFPLTLLGVQRLAKILEEHWESPGRDSNLTAFGRTTLQELDATALLIGALYASMDDFEIFRAVSLLYFAAAIYAETARRNGRADLASSFLLCDHPSFGSASARCLEQVLRHPRGQSRSTVVDSIRRIIAPINLAGLGSARARHWYEARDVRWEEPNMAPV